MFMSQRSVAINLPSPRNSAQFRAYPSVDKTFFEFSGSLYGSPFVRTQ